MKHPIPLKSLILFSLFFFIHLRGTGQALNSRQLDSLVEKTMKTFQVPGIGLAIVKDNKVIHAKGYGLRSLRTKEPTDEHTLFAIASNTKAFTTTALGMLVDEKKISWDTKVNTIVPEFKMYDAYVTDAFTIRDLVTHRSGLGLGAGDLMFWPDSANFTKAEIIHNLRFLKPVSGFRSKFDYDNLLYVVAGEIIKRVSGMSWEDFIELRIMRPLGMRRSVASYARIRENANVIDAHAPVNGKLQVLERHLSESTNAAGGINSSVADMAKWVMMHLNGGRYGEHLEKRLISAEGHRELWTPQTIYSDRSPYRTHFNAYGLGFFLSDENGYFVVEHTGGLAGMVSEVTMIPELHLGIIVLTNQQSGAAFTAITNQIKDAYYGIKGEDRIKQNAAFEQKFIAETTKISEATWKTIANNTAEKQVSIDIANYMGTYEDQWFGKVTISRQNDRLYFKADRSPKLKGKMTYYKGNTFIVKWEDRSLNADAYVIFSLDKEGEANGIKMQAISPITDFSFDFQDLDFKKVE